MPERSYTAKIENGPQAIAWLDRNAHERSQSLKRFVDRLANHALFWTHIYAPTGETLYLQQHIDRGVVTWHPGGFGGGGTWEVELGVRRGLSKHPLYVHDGTGIYAGRDVIHPRSDRAPASIVGGEDRLPYGSGYYFRGEDESGPRQTINAPIRSRLGRNPALTFQKRGEPRRFRAWVRGQRPQPFVYLAYLKASIYAQAHIGDVVRGIR